MTRKPQYDICRFKPEHAPGIVQSFLDVWGDTYPNAYVYDPKRLRELNESGELVSVVAVVRGTGEVVGHCAAIRCYPGGAAEASQAVVQGAHQGHSLLGLMSRLLDEVALERGIRRLITHEVTSHRASQVIACRAGFKTSCLALGAMPDTLEYRQNGGKVAQRESCVVSIKFLAPPEPATVCIPSRHRDMVEQIYGSFKQPVSFETASPEAGPGTVSIRHNPAWDCGDIVVQQLGTDTASEISQRLRSLHELGSTVVFLELPTNQGDLDDACRAAEAEGFFFAGIGPNTTEGGDSFFLQHLNTKLDMSLFEVASPMGKKIAKYVANERQRVGSDQ